MKRVLLFLATNLAIVLVLSVTLRVLGVEPHLTQQGLNLGSLLVFAAVFGMGGAFISLAISKWSAKRMTGAVPIETPATPMEIWLVQTVRGQARRFSSPTSSPNWCWAFSPRSSSCGSRANGSSGQTPAARAWPGAGR